MTEQLLARCSAKIDETKKKVQEATAEIKSNSAILASLALEDEDPKIKKREFVADVVDKYQNIVSAANETIGQCVSGLEDTEARLRKETVEAILLGQKHFAETTFRSAKSVCIKMNDVYACGFLGEKGEVTFIDKTYPLVADSVYLTGIQLGVRGGGRALSVDHLNYAVFDGHGTPPKVYRDEYVSGNEVLEDLPEGGRLSESCMNDTKEFSSSFEIDVLANGVLSIVLNMSPRLYEAIRGFEYTGPTDAAAAAAAAESTKTEDASADEEDTSDSLSSPNNAPTYYKPSEDPATRSADRMLSEEFSYTRDLHKVLVSIRNKGEWDKPLLVSTAKPSPSEEPLKVNPALEGLAKAIGDDRERAIAAFPYDVQKAIVKVVCGNTGPHRLAATNAVEKKNTWFFRHERDANIAKALLEDEDYGTKYALAITKEILASTRFLGGMGLDPSFRKQKETIEGMRSDWSGGHTALECLRQEELAEAIRDLLCTEFGAKMSASDAKILKSKPFHISYRPNSAADDDDNNSNSNKRRRTSPESAAAKRRKLKSMGVVVSPSEGEEEEEKAADDDETTVVTMGTVIPPPLWNEPKEITSSSAMTEMIARYSSVIARYIAKSPLSSIRMASVADLVFALKKTLSSKVSRKSANTVSIRPVETDNEESICSKMYTKLMARSVKGMEHVMNKHKAGESAENGMRALLTMRRLNEERNAYRHLVEVLILENTVGILSGEGVTWSNDLYNAAVWYMKIVIRNRICGNRNLLDDDLGAFTTEVCSQVNAALDWMFRFNIDHKLLLERNIVSDRAFAHLAPSGDSSSETSALFKPGGRFYAALIGGEDALPMKMVKMPSSTSILKTVGVLNAGRGIGDHMLCIDNYETGNMFMLSMAGVSMVEGVDKLRDEQYHYGHERWRQESSYLYATPSLQLARDVRKMPLFNEIVSEGRWDEFAAVPRGEEARMFRKMSKSTPTDAAVETAMTMPFLFRGGYRDSWKNLPLFGGNREGGEFQFRYEANPKGRLMVSLVDQALTAAPQEKKGLGKTLAQIVNSIEFYTKKSGAMDTRGSHTLSRACLVVYWKPSGGSEEEEVCRFDCTHSGSTNIDGVDLYAAVDFYEIRGPKNIGMWKRFISAGTASATTTTTAGEDLAAAAPLLGEDDKKQGEDNDVVDDDDDDVDKKKKMTTKKVADRRNDVWCQEDAAPFMSKMYTIVRQGQDIREKYTNKIAYARLKNADNKKQ